MTGTVTLSIEIELGWGPARLPQSNTKKKISEGRRRETETLHRLLDVCDENDVSVSFDVVGHLLLDSCDGDHDCPFPNHFDVCPRTDVATDPLYYAPDLIVAIRSSDIDHEICTHTFSHVDCHKVSEDVVKWEIRTAQRVHREFGLESPTSFVPPLHHTPSTETLTKTGIQTVRKPLPGHNPPNKPVLRHGWSLTKDHPIRDPSKTDGVLQTYCTPRPTLSSQHLPTGQLQPSPVFQLLPRRVRQRIHQRYLASGLHKAAEQDGFVHYWTHLFNLANEAQWAAITPFLKQLGQYQSNDDIDIKTMAELS